MYHGTAENQKARRQIVSAMFKLMEEKSFSEISVSDVIRSAGVARATYYRNFTGKDAVIDEYMQGLYNEIMPAEPPTDPAAVFDYDTVVTSFERALTILYRSRRELLTLYDSGFGGRLLETMNFFIENFAGDMPQSSTQRYLLYFIAGAAANVLIQWLKDGAKESPREMAVTCADIMRRPILH